MTRQPVSYGACPQSSVLSIDIEKNKLKYILNLKETLNFPLIFRNVSLPSSVGRERPLKTKLTFRGGRVGGGSAESLENK